jgi:hypothetical protein
MGGGLDASVETGSRPDSGRDIETPGDARVGSGGLANDDGPDGGDVPSPGGTDSNPDGLAAKVDTDGNDRRGSDGATVLDGGGADGGEASGTDASRVNCGATFIPSIAPVAVSASISCSPSSLVSVSVAAGTGTHGLVLANAGANGAYPAFLFDMDNSTSDVEQISPDSSDARVISNAAGVPTVVEIPRGGSLVWQTRAPVGTVPAWTSRTVAAIPSDPGTYQVIDGAIGPDAAEYVLYGTTNNTGSALNLATRPLGSGAFTSTVLSTTWPRSVLTVDTSKAPHVSYWDDSQGLLDWQPTQGVVVALPRQSTLTSLQRVRPSGVGVVLSLATDDGIHVVRRNADSVFDDIPIPSTVPTPSLDNRSSFPCSPMPSCPSLNQLGDYARGHALAGAADGTLWLATVRDHLDRSLQAQHTTAEACFCSWPVPTAAADRASSSSLAVQRIDPRSKTPSSILWSIDLGLALGDTWFVGPNNATVMDATLSGSLLFLAVRAPNPRVPTEARYFVIDTSGLH